MRVCVCVVRVFCVVYLSSRPCESVSLCVCVFVCLCVCGLCVCVSVCVFCVCFVCVLCVFCVYVCVFVYRRQAVRVVVRVCVMSL